MDRDRDHKDKDKDADKGTEIEILEQEKKYSPTRPRRSSSGSSSSSSSSGWLAGLEGLRGFGVAFVFVLGVLLAVVLRRWAQDFVLDSAAVYGPQEKITIR
jgi:hypothetical protein